MVKMRRQGGRVGIVEQLDVALENVDEMDEEEAQNSVRAQLIETFALADYDIQMEKLFQKDGRRPHMSMAPCWSSQP